MKEIIEQLKQIIANKEIPYSQRLQQCRNILTYDVVKKWYESEGFVFSTEKSIPNLFGIRLQLSTNLFDDLIGMVRLTPSLFKLEQFDETVEFFNATTDPGQYYLEHPMNTKGTFIMKPGQYDYKLGLHNGKNAFVQAGPVLGYRDHDMDKLAELNPRNTDKGFFGVDIHPCDPYVDVYYINRYSAGCQATQNQSDHTYMFDQYHGIEKYRKGAILKYALFSIVDEIKI